jgi:hypothetical protein
MFFTERPLQRQSLAATLRSMRNSQINVTFQLDVTPLAVSAREEEIQGKQSIKIEGASQVLFAKKRLEENALLDKSKSR